MKRFSLFLLSFFMSTALFAQSQTSDYDVLKDADGETVIFKGQCSFSDLQSEETFGWLGRGSEAYTPDKESIVYLRRALPGYDLVVLMGTWCEDTQNLLPKLHKTLMQTAYPMAQLQMYGVDRVKEAKYVEHKLYHVERVPTIIVIKNHNEIGRIVETPVGSIEQNLAAIVKKNRGE